MLDTEADLSVRVASLRRLSDLDKEKALTTAISVAEDPDEPPAVSVAVGAELARIASAHRWVTEFETRNMTEAAFDSYCEHLE
ncbi:hypothetical protein ACWGRF_11730 [Streptomyces zhihengii]